MNMKQVNQVGFSLVELMIAMVIGLLLIAGIGQVFLSGQQSFKTQSGTGKLQENARFALFFLQRDIRMAGFPRNQGPSTGQPTAAAFLAANTSDGASGAPDQIQIQYNSDPSVPDSDLDCLGQESGTAFPAGCAASNPAAANDDAGCSWVVTNHYFVQNGSLMCRGIGNAAAQPIVDGVEDFQILYGEDTDGDTYADVYRNASQVVDFNQVAAVRIGILLNTQEQVADTLDEQEYAVLDADPITPADDAATTDNELLYRRRVFTTTVEVRNRTQ